MTTQEKRLAEIREAIDAENVSLGELSELQAIAETHPQLFAGDPVLAEAAGIPEEQFRQGLKTAKHSCGPWEFDGSRIVSPDRYVCTVDDWSAPSVEEQYDEINRALHDEAQANARLIAAAPDLLEALRGAVGYAEMEGGFCEPPAWYILAKNAIDRAEGRDGE